MSPWPGCPSFKAAYCYPPILKDQAQCPLDLRSSVLLLLPSQNDFTCYVDPQSLGTFYFVFCTHTMRLPSGLCRMRMEELLIHFCFFSSMTLTKTPCTEQSFSKLICLTYSQIFLSFYYMPSTVLDTEDAAMAGGKGYNRSPCPHEAFTGAQRGVSNRPEEIQQLQECPAVRKRSPQFGRK